MRPAAVPLTFFLDDRIDGKLQMTDAELENNITDKVMELCHNYGIFEFGMFVNHGGKQLAWACDEDLDDGFLNLLQQCAPAGWNLAYEKKGRPRIIQAPNRVERRRLLSLVQDPRKGII